MWIPSKLLNLWKNCSFFSFYEFETVFCCYLPRCSMMTRATIPTLEIKSTSTCYILGIISFPIWLLFTSQGWLLIIVIETHKWKAYLKNNHIKSSLEQIYVAALEILHNYIDKNIKKKKIRCKNKIITWNIVVAQKLCFLDFAISNTYTCNILFR